MPSIIMTADANKVDGALKGPAFGFLSKLSQDDALPGLHIEPINNVRDDRVRTGRVNENFRAVLFKLEGSGEDATYVYVGIWPHDEAIARAQAATLTINPVNGLPELTSTPFEDPEEIEQAEASMVDTSEVKLSPGYLASQWSLTTEALVDELGIERLVAERAIAAPTEADLNAIADKAITWQGLALLDLAAGYSIGEVKERLGLSPVSDIPGAASDDDIIEAIRKPAAQTQFTYIDDNEELRRVIEADDFGAWRTFLHPEQRRYVEADYNGAFRLSGGAGTGKTVVLVHRARALANKNPGSSILLTTYTTTLADSLLRSLKELDPDIPIAENPGEPGIHVAGVDAVASRVLRGATPEHKERAVGAVFGSRSMDILETVDSKVWAEAVDAAPMSLEPPLSNPKFLTAEYEMVVLPNRVRTLDEYRSVRRPGRGVGLNRSRRDAVWGAIESYRATASIQGATDWIERSALTTAYLEERGPVFDHVLVDEAQDLTPVKWQLLRALVAVGQNDLFIAEDSHQRIYGHPVVLGRYGISIVGRSRRLTLNYRTTAENLAYAIGVLSGADYFDVEGEPESTSQYRSARQGPTPRLVSADSLTDELDKAKAIIFEWLGSDDGAHRAPETIGILVRDNDTAARVAAGLGDRGIGVRVVTGRSVPTGHPVVMTMHRAKGMEFEVVLIFGVGRNDLPAAYLADNDLDETEREDFFKRERSLLYVSATRARDQLVILWEGEPSELI